MTDSTMALAERLNTEYKAGLIVAQLENGHYDVGMLSGASMTTMFSDVSDDWLQGWLDGALFGASVGKAQAPTEAQVPDADTAMILAGQRETVVVGPKGNALIVEAYQADPPHGRYMDIPGYRRTNGGDLMVFFDGPVRENVMIRVIAL